MLLFLISKFYHLKLKIITDYQKKFHCTVFLSMRLPITTVKVTHHVDTLGLDSVTASCSLNHSDLLGTDFLQNKQGKSLSSVPQIMDTNANVQDWPKQVPQSNILIALIEAEVSLQQWCQFYSRAQPFCKIKVNPCIKHKF